MEKFLHSLQDNENKSYGGFAKKKMETIILYDRDEDIRYVINCIFYGFIFSHFYKVFFRRPVSYRNKYIILKKVIRSYQLLRDYTFVKLEGIFYEIILQYQLCKKYLP